MGSGASSQNIDRAMLEDRILLSRTFARRRTLYHFYCYQCHTPFAAANADTQCCPSCGEGFIEQTNVPEPVQFIFRHREQDVTNILSDGTANIFLHLLNNALNNTTERLLQQSMEAQQAANTPADKELVAKLVRKKFSEMSLEKREDVVEGEEELETDIGTSNSDINCDKCSGNELCVICTENYKGEDELIEMPCNHCFHSKCLLQWFEKHDTCPMCRYKLEDPTTKGKDKMENEEVSSNQEEEEEHEEGDGSRNTGIDTTETSSSHDPNGVRSTFTIQRVLDNDGSSGGLSTPDSGTNRTVVRRNIFSNDASSDGSNSTNSSLNSSPRDQLLEQAVSERTDSITSMPAAEID